MRHRKFRRGRDLPAGNGFKRIYADAAAKMDKSARFYGYTDYTDSRLSSEVLAILSDLPIRLIEEILVF
jgi:hypothetical protein